MLRKLRIKPTDDLPGVILDPKKNIFKIWGRVLPEDGNKFFAPLLEWTEKYVDAPNDHTEFRFKLDYYNSSTARMIVKMIVILESIQEIEGKTVKVVWEYAKDDDQLEERGEEMKSISELPFELKAY